MRLITQTSFALNLIEFEQWNFIIAVLALVIAIYGIWLTKVLNHFKMEIDNCTYSGREGDVSLFDFRLHNVSSVPAKITKIEFFTSENKLIEPLVGYTPETRYYDLGFGMKMPEIPLPTEDEFILDDPQVLQSNSSIQFSYYMEPPSTKIKIKVTYIRSIGYRKKSQSFTVEFRES